MLQINIAPALLAQNDWKVSSCVEENKQKHEQRSSFSVKNPLIETGNLFYSHLNQTSRLRKVHSQRELQRYS